MPKQATRTYSRIARHAAALLGKQIEIARKERKMTAQDLVDRAGISRGLLQRIEKGNLKCQIGAVFERFDCRIDLARVRVALLPVLEDRGEIVRVGVAVRDVRVHRFVQ